MLLYIVANIEHWNRILPTYANAKVIDTAVVTKKEDEVFSREEMRFFGAQIALALEYCHSKKIIYRDLKLENLVMKKNGYIQLIDFGLSKDCCL